MKKWIILFIAFLLLTACAGNTNHITYTINDEYELIRTSGNAFELFPSQDAVYATQYIPAKITEIAWDDKYIIAKQTEEKSDPNNPDGAIANKKSEQYWIIDVKHNKRFGPYNEKQFNEQKDAFKIKVPFQNVDSYIKEMKKQSA
ncbi:DUF3997 domain-containing protein [Bacillus hominis]|uniref:DUF3997 domain-containing protein n=1 Tax=Bacillus hominis TaxID=2817478 RepID=A0ABT7RB87_9BACI|nr:DUF3997 domain-containing protein [Bacillus hominis]EJQ48719.1 hypothetical protein IEQ_03391 [Bacillus cereus BAG6X1-2]SCM96945.1 Uncharacterized protein BWINRASL_03860 [Bacillus mycoides]MDM5195033.1 DUF3997 domain-containing protein [Bacillus hominis]MDM5434741.1 DUF3997 domain-containing protein [Bacillus hominis]MDM5440191.1 DUF3997 domain-containing protein [Bacillus hominis]